MWRTLRVQAAFKVVRFDNHHSITVLKNKRERIEKALSQLEVVEETGRANMSNPHSVQKVAHEEKLNDLLVFLGPNPSGRDYDNFQKLIEEYDV